MSERHEPGFFRKAVMFGWNVINPFHWPRGITNFQRSMELRRQIAHLEHGANMLEHDPVYANLKNEAHFFGYGQRKNPEHPSERHEYGAPPYFGKVIHDYANDIEEKWGKQMIRSRADVVLADELKAYLERNGIKDHTPLSRQEAEHYKKLVIEWENLHLRWEYFLKNSAPSKDHEFQERLEESRAQFWKELGEFKLKAGENVDLIRRAEFEGEIFRKIKQGEIKLS